MAPVALSASAITGFALLVHEFATNAAKYGALTDERGTIAIETRRKGDRLVLTWTESGGPSVTTPTSAEGFGSYLVRATVKTLDGEISHDWRPEGVVVRLDVTLARAQS